MRLLAALGSALCAYLSLLASWGSIGRHMLPSSSSGQGAMDQLQITSGAYALLSEGQHDFGLGVAKPSSTFPEVQRKGNLVPTLAPRSGPSLRGSRVLGMASPPRLGQASTQTSPASTVSTTSPAKDVPAVGEIDDMPPEVQPLNARQQDQLSATAPTDEGALVTPPKTSRPPAIATGQVSSAPDSSAHVEITTYPLVELSGTGATTAISDVWTSFHIQLKDSMGKNVTCSPWSRCWWSRRHPDVEVELRTAGNFIIPGDKHVHKTYLGKGMFRIDYLATEPGTYEWSLTTSDGKHLLCSQDEACSPVQMEVVPDRAVGKTSYAGGVTSAGREGGYDTVAGETGSFRVKTHDKHGYERHQGGDEVTSHLVPIAPTALDEGRHEGCVATVRDNADGTYDVSYVLEVAGTYMVQTRVNGERVQYCDKDSIPRPDRPLRDCDREDPTVTVVHGKLDASRCSLVEVAGQTGLEENPVGAAAGFSILSKDSFRNTRTGAATTSPDGNGDGTSDVFVVTLSDDRGHFTRTTSAVQDITVVGTNGTDSSFRLAFGGAISRPLSTSVSSAELQATLMSILGDDPVDVMVFETTSPSGDVAWRVTFLSHLEDWSQHPMGAVPDENGVTVVSVRKVASDGVYPVEYTLQYPGRYRMAVTDSGDSVVGEGSRIVEAASVDTQASWSSVTGDGLRGGVAGDQLSVIVQAKISPPQPKIQALVAWPQGFAGTDTTRDGVGGTFELAYGDRHTAPILFDATADDLQSTIEGLSAGTVNVTIERSADAPLWLVTFGGSDCSHVEESQRYPELCRSNHETPGGFEGKGLVGKRLPSIGGDQSSAGLLLHEISSGRPGVHQVDNRDLETLGFSLFLDEPGGGGTARDSFVPPAIGLYEKQGLSCFTKIIDEATKLSGYVVLEFMGNRLAIDSDASVSELRERVEDLAAAAGLASTSVVVTFPNDQDTMCGIHGGEVHIEYATTQTVSNIAISSSYGVSNASLREITKGVDGVSYRGRGRYLIEYTPIVSGKYSPEISIAGGKLTSEATVGGITILPAYVETLVETDKVGSSGVPHAFNVTAVDQDGRSVGPYTQGRIEVAVFAIPDPRAHVGNVSARFMAVALTTIEEPGGPCRVAGSFTPGVAGSYVVLVAFLKPDGVWDPVAIMSDYTGVASGQSVEGTVARSDTLDGDHELTTPDPVVVSILPGLVDPRMATISGKGFDECTAGTQCSFEITSRDSFGNKRFHAAFDEWQVSMTGPSETSLVARVGDSCQYPPSGPTLAARRGVTNGSYVVEYFVVTQGAYKVAVKSPPHSEPRAEIYQWSNRVNVHSNLASAADTIATGSGIDSAVAGEPATFQIQARDAWLNTKYDLRGEIRFTVVAFVAGANPDEVPPVYGVVGSPRMSNSGFRYPVTYTPLVGDEQYTLVVLLRQKSDTTPARHIGVDRHDHEIQVIRNTFPCTLDDSALSGDGFTIAFKGHSTSSLAFDASGSEVKDALEQLNTIGSVAVGRRDADKPACGYEYTVHFQPSIHDTLPHILNYGDLPDIVVETPAAADENNFFTTVYSSGAESYDGIPTRDGHAPYTPVVLPSPSSPAKTAASSVGARSSVQDNDDAASTNGITPVVVPPPSLPAKTAASSIESRPSVQDNDDAAFKNGKRSQEDPAAGESAPFPSYEHVIAPVEPGTPGAGRASSLGSPGTVGWGPTRTDDEWVRLLMVEMGLLLLIPSILRGLGMDVPAPFLVARAATPPLLATSIVIPVSRRLVLPYCRHLYSSAATFVRDLWLFGVDSLVAWPGVLGSGPDAFVSVPHSMLRSLAVLAMVTCSFVMLWLVGRMPSTSRTSTSEVEEAAACVVQAWWRRRLANRQGAATCLQNWIRRAMGGRRLALGARRFYRGVGAVVGLQARQRGWATRTRMAAMHSGAVVAESLGPFLTEMCRGVTNSDGVFSFNRCFLTAVVQLLRASPEFVGVMQPKARVAAQLLSVAGAYGMDDRRALRANLFLQLAGVFESMETEGGPLDTSDFEEAARTYLRDMKVVGAGRSPGDAVETLQAIISALRENFDERETRFIDLDVTISMGRSGDGCEKMQLPVVFGGLVMVAPFQSGGEEAEDHSEMLGLLGENQTELSYLLNNDRNFLRLTTAPSTLIVGIERHSEKKRGRVRREVSFPLDDLQLDTTSGGIVERASYMAVAVIKNTGEDKSSHYLTVVRQTTYPGSEWWMCNDSVVSTVGWDQVTIDAVAILYRRVPSSS